MLTYKPEHRQSFHDIRSTRLSSVLSPDDDYDPRLYRVSKHPISVWMAYFNLIRTGLGAGVLGVPLAISQAGIILGPILALFTVLLLIHSHLTLLRCLNEVSKHLRIPYISYRYGFRIALLHGPAALRCIGQRGPAIIATFMLLSQVGICTVFITFTSDSLRDIMDWENANIAYLLFPYLIMEFSMKNLKYISYVAMIGNLMNVIGLILVLSLMCMQTTPATTNKATTEALQIFFAFGTFLFNLSTVGVTLALDKSLLKSKVMVTRFGVVAVGMMVPATIATVFGVLGYWSFGAMEENVLRSLPFDEDMSMAAIGLFLIAIAFAYPIQCYPAIQILIEVIKNHDEKIEPTEVDLKIYEYIARPCFVLLTFFIAYLVPFQGPFVAFVGNVCTTMLALVFPAMMEISLMYPGPYGKYNIYLIKNILIILLGISSWVFGAFLCGKLIYIRIMYIFTPDPKQWLR